MPHSFREVGLSTSGGADPLVRAGRPRPALALDESGAYHDQGAGQGPAADEGVRPTIDADGRNWENYVALGRIACPKNMFT
jgi:hypothetical protein